MTRMEKGYDGAIDVPCRRGFLTCEALCKQANTIKSHDHHMLQ